MSDLLSIGSSGILAYQYALTATSNNIANAAVEGYSRQEVELGTSLPRLVGVQFFGSGTYVQGLKRQFNEFIEANLRRSRSELEGQAPLVSYANRVFDVLASKQIGLSTAFSKFFSSVRSLAVEPASLIARSTMLREVDGVASSFRQVAGQLDLLGEETYQGLLSATAQVNTLGAELATLIAC
jgi:flagellar hook-associated protein 1 FlgK